jgi:hypothetical protein
MPIMANLNLLDGDQQIAVATTKLEVMVLLSPNTMDIDFECVVAISHA